MSAERNRFWDHVGWCAQVSYHVATDFSLSAVPDAHFDYFFSFGVFCHISPPLVARYIESLSRKLTHGAHAFFLIADYGKYNSFVTTSDRHGLKRAVADCFPGAAADAVRGTSARTSWHVSSATRTRTITSIPTAGITSVSRPVSRDPIVHFRKV